MRLRNVKNKEEILNNSLLLIKDYEKYKGKWNEVFSNSNPIYIEIGMGKGKFILENALKYPDINFIGIERLDSILARAIQKIEKVDPLPKNLKIVRMDAKNIEDAFDKEIDRLYLNFSDPWPKKRHTERRLTSNTFLKKYENIFKNTKEIIMKTDNVSLFEFSLVTLSNNNYILERVSLNLHNSDIEDNIMTEYEEKFYENSVNINYLRAKKSSDNKK